MHFFLPFFWEWWVGRGRRNFLLCQLLNPVSIGNNKNVMLTSTIKFSRTKILNKPKEQVQFIVSEKFTTFTC